MLACEAPEFDKIKFPVLVQPKLDGIRCIITDGVAYSRNLKPIPNKFIQETVKDWPNPKRGFYDGELMLQEHTINFSEVSSAVMSAEGEPDFVFCSFFKDFSECKSKHYRDVMTSGALQQKDVESLVSRHKELGYEGTMLWNYNQHYKFGRSTKKDQYLLKVKEFIDDEAEVIGIVEKMKNNNKAEKDALGRTKRSSAKAGKVPAGVMGALVLRWRGTEFEIGTGFTAAQRKEIWENRGEIIGSIVKFKYQEVGSKGRPRFPSFLGFRHKDDL